MSLLVLLVNFVHWVASAAEENAQEECAALINLAGYRPPPHLMRMTLNLAEMSAC
jgi:hypothetical protein